MQNRPAFIFVEENNFSPALSNMLAKLAPGLKQAGYDHFYNACSSKFSYDQYLRYLQDQIQLLETGKALLPVIRKEMLEYMPATQLAWMVDINYYLLNLHFTNIIMTMDDTPTLFYYAVAIGLLKRCANEIGKNKMTRDVVENVLNNYAEGLNISMPPLQANLAMLQTMHACKMQYKGIEDPALRGDQIDCSTASGCYDSMNSIIEMAANTEKRNKAMVYAYLQAYASVIGVTGLLNVTGMQELLTTMIPAEIARANFHFVYVYREPLDESRIPEVNKIREEYRTGKVALPMGLILIDGMGKNEEDIIAEVMLRINEKIAEFELLPEHLKQIPDISITGQIRSQINNVFALFGRAKDSAAELVIERKRTLG
jgi:hypothetical protein